MRCVKYVAVMAKVLQFCQQQPAKYRVKWRQVSRVIFFVGKEQTSTTRTAAVELLFSCSHFPGIEFQSRPATMLILVPTTMPDDGAQTANASRLAVSRRHQFGLINCGQKLSKVDYQPKKQTNTSSCCIIHVKKTDTWSSKIEYCCVQHSREQNVCLPKTWFRKEKQIFHFHHFPATIERKNSWTRCFSVSNF